MSFSMFWVTGSYRNPKIWCSFWYTDTYAEAGAPYPTWPPSDKHSTPTTSIKINGPLNKSHWRLSDRATSLGGEPALIWGVLKFLILKRQVRRGVLEFNGKHKTLCKWSFTAICLIAASDYVNLKAESLRSQSISSCKAGSSSCCVSTDLSVCCRTPLYCLFWEISC